MWQPAEIPALKAMIDDPLIKNDEKASAVAVQSALRHGDARVSRKWRSVGAGERGAGAQPDPANSRRQPALDNAEKQIKMQIEAMQASNQ